MAKVSPEIKTFKNRVTFDGIWDLIRKINMISGVFLFPGITKNVWLKRILMCNAPLSFGIVLIFAYGTLQRDDYSLMSHILVHSILINYATVFYGFSCIKRNNTEMIGFMEWCGSLYRYKEKFHPIQYEIAETRMNWVHVWAIRVIQVAGFILWFDSTMISVGFAFVGLFLPENIYPKYSAPMPYYFPIEDQKNWKVLCLTLFCQFKCSIDLASFHQLFLSIFYTVSIHIYTHLEIIKETIELLKEKLQKRHEKQLSGKTTSNDVADDDLPIQAWIKLIVDMICESNKTISTFGQIFTGYFFLFELASFGSLFIFGLIMLVIHQQFFFAFGIVCASFILFSFCFINEQFLEKFEEISEALYDIPWYTLTPKERILILPMMSCSDIQRGFMASGIHSVTFERFNKIVQAAYSNVLVLKDLVLKF